jgi:hypothetical protein
MNLTYKKGVSMKYFVALILLCCFNTASFSNEAEPMSKHQKALSDSIQQVFYKEINTVIAPIFEIPKNILSGWPNHIKIAPQCKCCSKFYFKLSAGWLSFICADSMRSDELDFYADRASYLRISQKLKDHNFKIGSNWIGDTFEYGSVSISFYKTETMPKDNCLENQFASNPYCFRIIPKIRS